MKFSELDRALAAKTDIPTHSDAEVLEHFKSKYGAIEIEGRTVFVFNNERGFGDHKHIVSVHGSNAPYTPEHIYQYVLITYCWSGKFQMTIDGKPVALKAGECVILDRHVPHSVERTGKKDVAINIVLSDRFFERRVLADVDRLDARFPTELTTPGIPHSNWSYYQCQDDELVRDCVGRALCEHFDPKTGSADIIDDFVAALITHLFRTYEHDVRPYAVAQERSELIGKVREYISEHFQEGKLNSMAAAIGYEPTYLSSTIRRATGRTFKQLVNEERMRRSMILLQGTELPAYEIAKEVGISNLTQFYKRFRECYDCTPQEYRERVQNK